MPALAWVNLVVGLVAASGVIITWRQKVEADRRAEWWRRVSWAFDHILSAMTTGLKESKLATGDDREMFRLLADDWIISKTGDEHAEGGAR